MTQQTPSNQEPNLVQPDQVIPMDAAALVEFNYALRDQVKHLQRAYAELKQVANDKVVELQNVNNDLVQKINELDGKEMNEEPVEPCADKNETITEA